jgi:hypothetical protein
MATVYLARDLTLDRLVAVKVLHPELATYLGGGRFTREIRITSRLRHPGILPLLDSGETEGLPFFTMPFVDGETLAQRLERDRQLPVDVALTIAFDILDPLEYAHAEGVLHRDIKPSNVLLANGHVMLADFGVARAADSASGETLSDSGLAVGTAHYMSPEQASADRVDARSDIYSVGCVLYEMLAGCPPFTGPTTQAILARHAIDVVPSLRTVRRTVSRPLERAIERSLAKVPADRYATAAQFRAALLESTRTDAAEEAPTARRRRRAIVVAGTVAVLATAVVAAVWPRSSGPLDAKRIVGFPLRSAASAGNGATSGEDVATAIGSALDRRESMRWIDGWRLLPATERNAATGTEPATARSIARDQHAAYYLTGRLVPAGDSMDVFLELVDVASDSVIARPRARGPSTDPWRAGLRAVNELLPILIPGGATRDLAAGWADRNPAAVANFLAGEAAFRRVQPALALTHYRDAVAADSNFALAAVRGAQAATWADRPAEAALLVRMAIGKPMAPQYAHFTLGYAAYLSGLPDSAIAEFHRALGYDPEMAAAWAQLGETYIHLVPSVANADSLAEAAFDAARASDSSSSQLLQHPIELRLRRGDAEGAERLMKRFVAARPSATTVAELELAGACVRKGAQSVDWAGAVRKDPSATLWSGVVLAGRGAFPECAAAAYGAVLDGDTATNRANRQSALIGMVGILLAQDRPDLAAARIAKSVARGDGGSSLLLLAAPVSPALASAAVAVAAKDAARFGADYAHCSTTERCWILGVYQTARGNSAAATTIAAVLTARTTKDSLPYARLLAQAAAAEAMLAQGDSAGARAALRNVLAEPLPAGSSLAWDYGGALGAERLAYAGLLLAHGEASAARMVADAFDAPAPASHALYLRASLELRARAADRQQDARAATAYRARLSALGRKTASTSRRGDIAPTT